MENKQEKHSTPRTPSSVKHGGGNIMFWGCFSVNGPGKLVKVNVVMRKEDCVKILEQNIRQSAENLGLGM